MSVKSRRVILAQGGGTPSFRIPTAPVVVTVANVVGLNVTSANTALRNQGLIPTSTGITDTAPVNTVLSQNPTAGSSAQQGSTVVLTISNGAGSGGTDFGSDLRTWMTQPGNQVLTLPGTIANPRTYTAGLLSAVHQHTTNLSGTYGGWLILKAEEVGGVTIDLAAGLRALTTGDYRIMFIGCQFENGMVSVIPGANQFRWWHCDMTFPPAVWATQFEAAGGTWTDHIASAADTTARSAMANPFPSAIRSTPGTPPARATGIGFYGSDLHDFGDDGVFVRDMDDVFVVGCKIWNVEETVLGVTYDPNQSGAADWWHNDSIQSTGRIDGLTITDSSMGGATTTLGGDTSGNTLNFSMSDMWFYDTQLVSTNNPMRFYSKGGNVITGSIETTNIKCFNLGTSIQEYRDTPAVVIRIWPSTFNDPTRFPTVTGSLTIDTTFPSGVTAPAGLLTTQQLVLDHVDNPANIWRAANVIGSWATYFAGNWP